MVVVVLGLSSTYGQIVNIESLRRASDTSRWSGNASINFKLTQNTNKIIELYSRIHLQHVKNKHTFLFVNDYDFKESNDNRLIDKSIQHLRYNYKINQRWSWEAFTQAQSNEVSSIELRWLLGSGVRMALNPVKQLKIYIGTAAMYEYEHLKEETKNLYHNYARNSTYMSFKFFPNDKVSLVGSIYYQPRFDRINDYRISSDNVLLIKLFKNLSFNTHFTIWHDAFPALGIEKTQYKLTTGLTYIFNKS